MSRYGMHRIDVGSGRDGHTGNPWNAFGMSARSRLDVRIRSENLPANDTVPLVRTTERRISRKESIAFARTLFRSADPVTAAVDPHGEEPWVRAVSRKIERVNPTSPAWEGLVDLCPGAVRIYGMYDRETWESFSTVRGTFALRYVSLPLSDWMTVVSHGMRLFATQDDPRITSVTLYARFTDALLHGVNEASGSRWVGLVRVATWNAEEGRLPTTSEDSRTRRHHTVFLRDRPDRELSDCDLVIRHFAVNRLEHLVEIAKDTSQVGRALGQR